MNDADYPSLAARLEAAERRIEELEDRVAVLDGLSDESWHGAQASSGGEVAPREESGATLLTLVGRTFLILSGAFLVRAATDAQILPHAAGVAVGLVYGSAWLVMASRRSADRPREATFFALSTALICFPLLYEATLQFGILAPALTVVLLMAVWGVGVGVAYRADLRGAAWLFSVGAGSTGLALCFGGGLWVPYSFAVLAMALSGLWLGYLRGWTGLAVVGTAVADAVVIALTLLNVLEPTGLNLEHLEAVPLLALQLGLVALFVGSYLVRALFSKSHVSFFDILQAITATILGYAGALQTANEIPAGAAIVGGFAAVTAVFGYAITFRYMDLGEDARRNFGFFTTAALVSALIGATHLFHGATLTAVLIVAGVVLVVAGTKAERATLSLHGSIYALSAGFSSGLVVFSLRALIGSPEALPAAQAAGIMTLVLAVAMASFLSRVTDAGRTWGKWSRSPKLLSSALLSLGFLGFLGAAAGQWMLPQIAEPWQAAAFSAFRTGILSLAAIAVVLVGRMTRLREASLLMPALLVSAAASLVLGDLRIARPAALVISLVLFGIALMLAPRLRAKTIAPS